MRSETVSLNRIPDRQKPQDKGMIPLLCARMINNKRDEIKNNDNKRGIEQTKATKQGYDTADIYQNHGQ